ncbi:MAG: cytochrome c [Chloroflexi bacterium]|nr:cytochrome c [Chloroflexota bacterium]
MNTRKIDKRQMSDGLDKKVALGLALTVALLLATGLYWFAEPSRQKGAGDKYNLATAEIFAQNCFYCHGRLGTGSAGPSLPQTKLDEEGLKKTISRGVIIMPAWAREEGGTLTPFQVQGLATFILNWDEELVTEAFALHPILPPPPTPPIPPPPYAGMKNPFPWGDPETVQMGELLYERACIRCHWTRMTKPYFFSFMSPVYSQSLEEYPAYYFWTVSEGLLRLPQGGGMPPHKLYLPEKQRWQVLNYLWAMGKEYQEKYEEFSIKY